MSQRPRLVAFLRAALSPGFHPAFRFVVGAVVVALLAAGCGASATNGTPSGNPSASAASIASNGSGASIPPAGVPASSASAAEGASELPPPSLDSRPRPGNNVAAPLPTDAPAVVRALSTLPSCGAQILFEPDPDVSPLPTPPRTPTSEASNMTAATCLISDWENGRKGQLAVSAISDEQDEIYTLYRLTGDGTVDVLNRVKSHPDQAVTWTDATCRELSLQGTDLTPADCSPETPLN